MFARYPRRNTTRPERIPGGATDNIRTPVLDIPSKSPQTKKASDVIETARASATVSRRTFPIGRAESTVNQRRKIKPWMNIAFGNGRCMRGRTEPHNDRDRKSTRWLEKTTGLWQYQVLFAVYYRTSATIDVKSQDRKILFVNRIDSLDTTPRLRSFLYASIAERNHTQNGMYTLPTDLPTACL